MHAKSVLVLVLVTAHCIHAQYGGGGYGNGYGNGGGGGDGNGGGNGRKHIKLNFGIHVPPIVLKMPRMEMPKVTIKANFLKQPNAKPLELDLPPPPQISFGDSDDGSGGRGGGAGGGNGGYGGYDNGGYGNNGYGGGSQPINLQKSIKIEQGGGNNYGGNYGGGMMNAYGPPPPSYGGGSSYGGPPAQGGYGPPPPMDGGYYYPQAYDSAPQPQIGAIPYIEAKSTAGSNNVPQTQAPPNAPVAAAAQHSGPNHAQAAYPMQAPVMPPTNPAQGFAPPMGLPPFAPPMPFARQDGNAMYPAPMGLPMPPPGMPAPAHFMPPMYPGAPYAPPAPGFYPPEMAAHMMPQQQSPRGRSKNHKA